jgi:LmbE family N-acetylglucosaminyl deacetylase
VLSPHRDDAVFSLGRWMRCWLEHSWAVRIFNFYTVSEYAPWITGADRSRTAVVSRRADEDRAAIRLVSPRIEQRSFRLLDAPLRLGVPVAGVMQVNSTEVRESDRRTICGLLDHIEPSAFVLAPLGLGGHIDHLTVRQAAVACLPAHRLAFYEDLPYASWTPAEVAREQVREVSRLPLRKTVCSSYASRMQKQTWMCRYRTQIRREDAQVMARHSETIWAPMRISVNLP